MWHVKCFYKIFIFSTLLSRRSSSHFLRTKEGKDFSNKDDENNCSICQYALIESEVTEVQPCKHNFHKACIDELKKYDPTVKFKYSHDNKKLLKNKN